MDAAALRAEFPVLSRIAYLNAGTAGPLPRAAVRASGEVLEAAAEAGRALAYFEGGLRVRDQVRDAYAALLDARSDDVALTTSTSDGIARVVAGLGLRAGDEVLTSDQEHPGLLGPLVGARDRLGVAVRAVPLADLPDAVGPRTRLVACSHVGWVSGELAPEALRELDVPVLLDGAQGIGAVPARVGDLGCAFYAGPGQKWLCGPVGTGMLWVAPEWSERLEAVGPTFLNLEEPNEGLDARLAAGARRHDAPSFTVELFAAAAAAFVVLAQAGWVSVQRRAAVLADRLASELADRGFAVAPRATTTLVSWEVADARRAREALAVRGVVVRDLPGRPLLRASVGAWNDEGDLERLLDGLGAVVG
jgi:L-cysteine/cystine lyase